MKSPNYKITLLSCYFSYFVQAISINLLPLFFIVFNNDFAITLPKLSALILIIFIAQLFSDIVSIKIIDWFGYRATMLVCMLSVTIGLIMLGFMPKINFDAYNYLVICAVFFSVGAGMMEAALSPIIDQTSANNKQSAMAVLHSFYCWGIVVVISLSTIYLYLFGLSKWHNLAFFWSIVPITVFVLFSFAPILKPISRHERTKLADLVRQPMFIICFLVMVCSGASEMIITQWISFFTDKGLGLPKLFGDLLGVCSFAFLMGCGRLFFGIFGKKIDLYKLIFFSSIATFICYIAVALVPNNYVSLAFCALCGATVAILWPGTFSLSSESFPKASYLLFSLLAFAGDLGCSIGPSLTGFAASSFQESSLGIKIAQAFGISLEQVGLRFGILVGGIFPLLLIICLLVYSKFISKKSRKVEEI